MGYSQSGLILDIIGVLILFKFGLPSGFQDGTEQLKFPRNLARDKNNKKIKLMARLGLLFLIVGFILQFLGTFIH